eukprot:scaffold17019_cov22-Prasinocladus_malaysianus.AAC.1
MPAQSSDYIMTHLVLLGSLRIVAHCKAISGREFAVPDVENYSEVGMLPWLQSKLQAVQSPWRTASCPRRPISPC